MSIQRASAAAVLIAASLLSGCRCGWESPKPTAPDALAQTLLLAVDVPFAELDLPQNSRPHVPVAPEKMPLSDWRQNKAGAWTTSLPIRLRTFYNTKPLAGMRLTGPDGQEVPHAYLASDRAESWDYDEHQIRVRGLSEAPADGTWHFEYPAGTARERALNFESSGKKAMNDFVRTTAQAGTTEAGYLSRTGLLLPAPAKASWDITVPPAAELRFTPSLERPEVLDDEPSDGASVVITLTTAGETQELWRGTVSDEAGAPVRVDLDALAGKQGRLTVETLPGASARFDYVFLADPVVASRKASPRHIVLVFVDTLRPDHTSAYGYERDTTPALTAIAAGGVRFDQARSVAPWTLPSARTMMTGRDPEAFFTGGTLPGALGRAGWATAMLAGNLYLGPNFGLNRDWGTHFVQLLPRGDDQVDRALAWLDQQEGRDAFLLLHLMDCHLPYDEPDSYRQLWAGNRPDSIKQDAFFRAAAASLRTKEDRQYVRDRYDGSIRYSDDQLARVYDRLGPNDAVIFLADHGEEFWEHGGYEHGHALWDEILQIPLIVRAPGLVAGSIVDAPVSMLDVAPTIAAIAGVELPGAQGVSLLPLARADAGAADALRARDLAFGRPLYGDERWGVLHEQSKYQTVAGREQVYDLTADPEERRDLTRLDHALPAQMRGYLAGALGRDVVVAYRLSNQGMRRPPDDELVVILDVPGGVRAAWKGDEATESSSACVDWEPGGSTVEARWSPGWRGERVVWVLPNDPLAQVTPKLSLDVTVGDARQKYQPAADGPVDLTAPPRPILKETTGSRGWDLGFGVTPVPLDGGVNLSGYDEDTSGLAAIGYVVGQDHGHRTSECGSRRPAP